MIGVSRPQYYAKRWIGCPRSTEQPCRDNGTNAVVLLIQQRGIAELSCPVPHASAGRLLVRAKVPGKRLADNQRSTLENIAAHEKHGRALRRWLDPLTAQKLIADTRLPLDRRAQRATLGLNHPA
jgi:hypothetical protein